MSEVVMDGPLSANEREALARFVSKLIDDVDKLAGLYESRGVDSTLPRAAQNKLQRTLEQLQTVERLEIELHAAVPDTF
jgi:hypothetical protein